MNGTKTRYSVVVLGVMATLLALTAILMHMERSRFLHDSEYHWPLAKITKIDNLSKQRLAELRKECGEPLLVVNTDKELRGRCGAFWPYSKVFIESSS